MSSKRLIFASAMLAVASVAAVDASASAASSAGTSSGGEGVYLVSSLLGRNEVPGTGGAVGDPDGRAVEVLKIKGSTVTYTLRWEGISPPTAAHIHAGGAGTNGDVKIPLFTSRRHGHTAKGSVRVKDRALLAALVSNPLSFYTNLHTNEFRGGAVRGQLHKVSQPIGGNRPDVDVAPVVRGVQIYACTGQADGTFAFTQHDVSALLRGDIRHSFVQPVAGPPQWVAPDGSAVTGSVVLRTPNGAGNIPELDLRATQTGADRGRLADVVEIMRLNTVGGIAPAGTCDPQATPTAEVPYQADYVFIG
ncbi:CHRD domain-containing protein [Streptosporangium sp. CA-135522]|uniref:CHRD domain-containing protein n=1 Tax=Streptosporangium sp. CA-135522 TaxID=3240072 RepID=UPI003D8A8BAC